MKELLSPNYPNVFIDCNQKEKLIFEIESHTKCSSVLRKALRCLIPITQIAEMKGDELTDKFADKVNACLGKKNHIKIFIQSSQ